MDAVCLVPSGARTSPWHNSTYHRLQESALDSWHRSVSGWRLSAHVEGWFDCDRQSAHAGSHPTSELVHGWDMPDPVHS